MSKFKLRFELVSDAVFGSGSGSGSLVDIEVQHDEYGCPYLGGRALKGVLCEECANILYALELQSQRAVWEPAALRLFGNPGSALDEGALLRFGNAVLPEQLHKAIVNEIRMGRVSAEEVLESFSAVRLQTAVNFQTGTAKDKSLRSKRVVLRKTAFEADLDFTSDPDPADLQLLAACVKAFRRAGTGRNRGPGELIACLLDQDNNDITMVFYPNFREAAGLEVGA